MGEVDTDLNGQPLNLSEIEEMKRRLPFLFRGKEDIDSHKQPPDLSVIGEIRRKYPFLYRWNKGELKDLACPEEKIIEVMKIFDSYGAGDLNMNIGLMRTILDRICSKIVQMIPNIKITVVARISDLPKHLSVDISEKGQYEGAIDPETNTIYLVADCITDIQKTTGYELIGLLGVHGLLRDGFKQVMNRISTAYGPEKIGDIAKGYGLDLNKPKEKMLVIEKLIIQMAEEAEKDKKLQISKILKEIITAIRGAFEEMDFKVKNWTDDDFRQLLKQDLKKRRVLSPIMSDTIEKQWIDCVYKARAQVLERKSWPELDKSVLDKLHEFFPKTQGGTRGRSIIMPYQIVLLKYNHKELLDIINDIRREFEYVSLEDKDAAEEIKVAFPKILEVLRKDELSILASTLFEKGDKSKIIYCNILKLKIRKEQCSPGEDPKCKECSFYSKEFSMTPGKISLQIIGKRISRNPKGLQNLLNKITLPS